MKIELHGKNGLEITGAMRTYAISKISKIQKLYEKEINILVVHEVFPNYQKTEVTIPTKYYTLRGEEKGEHFYSNIDLIVDKLERQIKKHKAKVNKSLRGKKGMGEIFKNTTSMDDLEKELVKSKYKEKTINPETLTPKEAEMALEMLDHDFFIYKDDRTGNTAVIYKRNIKGTFGIIKVE